MEYRIGKFGELTYEKLKLINPGAGQLVLNITDASIGILGLEVAGEGHVLARVKSRMSGSE